MEPASPRAFGWLPRHSTRHSRATTSSPCSGRLLRSAGWLPTRRPASPRAAPAVSCAHNPLRLTRHTLRRNGLARAHSFRSHLRDEAVSAHSTHSFPRTELRAATLTAESPLRRSPRHALHSSDLGVDPSFDIPPDSCPPGSRLRQHQQRLPAHLCPPRGGLPSRFLETISPPSRQLRAPVSQSSNLSRPKYLQTPVARDPATPATVRVRRLPSDIVRLATRPVLSYPSPLRASQRIYPSGLPSGERGGGDSISGFPKIFIRLGANQTTSFPVTQFIPASPSTSFPVDESARDETTVWLPKR
jgi:hypothetical protein